MQTARILSLFFRMVEQILAGMSRSAAMACLGVMQRRSQVSLVGGGSRGGINLNTYTIGLPIKCQGGQLRGAQIFPGGLSPPSPPPRGYGPGVMPSLTWRMMATFVSSERHLRFFPILLVQIVDKGIRFKPKWRVN